MSPDRRTFLAGALATGGMALSGMGRAAAQGAAGPLIFDAMGEMRLEYDGDLIKQIKASGLNAITVTLTDPKVSGQRATDEAIDAVLAHDQHIKAHPEWFLKATRVEDIERAIENDHMSPTFDAVQRLAEGLEIDITELFASSAGERPSGRRSVTRAGDGRGMETPVYAHKLLASELVQKRILPFVTRIKARSFDDFKELKGHKGEEFVYVLEGEVLFYTEHYEPERLGPGDSIYFDSGMHHGCISVSEEDAVVLWINTG